MFDMWKEELTDEERRQLIEKAAEEIKKRKLEAPAALFFELHKPLAPIWAQAAIVFSPFTVPFFGFDFVNNYSRLLSKRENVDLLLDELERRHNVPSGGAEA